MAKYCNIKVGVDDPQNAKQISSVASRFGVRIGLLVDLNLGGSTGLTGILDRCGITPGPDAVKLAQAISNLKNVDFKWIMGYEGGRTNLDLVESRALVRKAYGLLSETKESIEAKGLNVEVVSCGGTTSYKEAAEFPGVTEVQAGTYVLMDTYHHRFTPEFEFALSVLARVISVPRPGRAIADAGGTAISTDAGLPIVKGRDDLRVEKVHAEHALLKADDNSRYPVVGETLELLPTNIDTTTCLHDEYILVQVGEVLATLNIAARGRFR